ncbi:hypothetical protein [Romboutsia lituseburensis]|uniref:hypothetical protein n=1 Tax=Romboutsia lituseburensis TaxID=1537 RepID=UPI00215B2FF1|nr:hypothetical protein [Romboutsia lituseburensis]MCR8747209.1 hypothetical protein [Romboutsia lituseburensis]
MQDNKGFEFISKIGIIVYLFGTCITAFLYITDGPSSPFVYKEVSNLLHALFIISVITSISILKTNHKYILSFILMILSSIFFLFFLNPLYGKFSPWQEDIMKASVYTLLSNTLIIISIIYSYKKCKKAI